MKIADLRGKNVSELIELLKKTQSEVKSSAADVLIGKSKDTSKTRKIKREVAQIKTVLTEKELISAEAEIVGEKENA